MLLQLQNINLSPQEISEYISVDEDLITYDIPSDNDIVQSFSNATLIEDNEEEEEEAADEIEELPTVKEALQGIKKTILFLELVENDNSCLLQAYEMEKELEKMLLKGLKQARITDYFPPQV